MNALAKIEQSLLGMSKHFSTMTPAKISKIFGEKMVPVERANKTLGRRNTQHTNQLMTLTMLTMSPYRQMRQCLSQIEKKRLAIEDAYFKNAKLDVRIKEWLAKDTEMSRIRIQEARYQQERGAMYIEGAIKEIATFQDAMEEIRISNGIPENWTERDAEDDEVRHHIMQAFRQSHRDMLLTGHITQGNAEYLEQYGIHLQTAERIVGDYIQQVNEMMDTGKMPSVEHLYEFLDHMANEFYSAHKLVMNRIGLKTIIRDDYLYVPQLEESRNGNH